jgi:glycosyltransferase involved in cell wall biosynthesis
MNKGLKLATGEVIGILNADDILQDESVISQVVAAHADQELDACYADLVYVKQNDLTQVTRFWRSRDFRKGLCFSGWMPAHPTLYLKRRVYDRVGNFNTDLRYQADLEFCVRAFELHSINSRYIPKLWVRMRLGGVTNNSIRSMVKGNWESYLALRKLGLKRDPISYFLIKFGSKLPSFLRRN